MRDTISLIHHYVDLCQSVIRAHGDYFPYKQIFSALRDQLDHQTVTTTVFLTDENMAVNRFILTVPDQGDVAVTPKPCSTPTCCGSCDTYEWKITRAYLQKVCDDPDQYLTDPALLDWGWVLEEEPE